MNKLNQISLDSTVSIKVDCLLNQDLLVKNFQIIMDCLRDLKSQQDRHGDSLKDLQNLKDLFEKNGGLLSDNSARSNGDNSQGDAKDHFKIEESNNEGGANQIASNSDGKSSLSDRDLERLHNDLKKEVEQLRSKVSKNEGSINGNTKDINHLLKGMKDGIKELENLKKGLGNKDGSDGTSVSSLSSKGSGVTQDKSNLSKNQNLSVEGLKDLNRDYLNMKELIKDLEREMEEMRKRISDLESQMKDNQNSSSERDNAQNDRNNNSSADKDLSDLYSKLDRLTSKVNNVQDQTKQNINDINSLNESQENLNQKLNDHSDDLEAIHKEIDELRKALERLQNTHNSDTRKMEAQIQRLREEMMKLLSEMKQNSSNEGATNNDKGNKTSYGGSFRKKSDSSLNGNSDHTSKLNDLASRVAYLEKMLAHKSSADDNNPEKLPMIKRPKKDMSMTSYNQKAVKKDLSDLKHEIEIWVKSYMSLSNPKSSNDSGEWELKLQEIKNSLGKKADHEGMKKGLGFLEGKITQLYLFLTEPDSQDAMIVRKGFNCLSCSKKVESLRGKLGPRMNWDNLQSTSSNMNAHTPPKNGFPKYSESPEK